MPFRNYGKKLLETHKYFDISILVLHTLLLINPWR